MFNIGEILKIDIVMYVTTYTIRKGDQMWSYVELVPELVCNLMDVFLQGDTWRLENIYLFIIIKIMFVIDAFVLFCFAKFDTAEELYNFLAYLISLIKCTI